MTSKGIGIVLASLLVATAGHAQTREELERELLAPAKKLCGDWNSWDDAQRSAWARDQILGRPGSFRGVGWQHSGHHEEGRRDQSAQGGDDREKVR